MAKKQETHTSHAEHEITHLAAQEHKAAKVAHKVDSKIYMGEVLASGDPKRIERYFLRKWLYRMFGKFVGKTVNRI